MFVKFTPYNLNQAHFHYVAQRFLNFFQIVFSALIEGSPSDGGNARGVALSTKKQDINLRGNYLAKCGYPKKMVRNKVEIEKTEKLREVVKVKCVSWKDLIQKKVNSRL